MKIVNMTIKGKKIINIIDSISNQLDIVYKFESSNIVILMTEGYYTRSRGHVASNLIFQFIDEEVKIEIVTSVGKHNEGMDFGAENSECKKIGHDIMTICDNNSWEVTEIYPEEFKERLLKSSKEILVNKISNFFTKGK